VTLTVQQRSNEVVFDYSASGTQVFTNQSFTFQGVATATGPFTFTWRYSGFHAFFQARASLTAFADGPGGRVSTVLMPNRDVGGGFDVPSTGSVTLNLTAGQPYGFVATGSNFDSDSRLIGTISILQQ
jgi:hypothetical protein